MAGRGELRGIDEIYDGNGALLAPLGFGFSNDWETIERIELSGASSHGVFWDPDVYDEIEFVVANAEVSTDTADVRFRLSTDGSTFQSGATDYDSFRHGANTSADNVSGNLNADHMVAILSIGTTGDEVGMCRGTIAGASGTTTKKMVQWSHSGLLSDGLLNRGDYSGMLVSSDGQIRGIQFFASTGTFSGLVIVRGRRKVPTAVNAQDDWVVIDDQAGISGVSTHDVFWDDQVWDEIEITVQGLTVNTDSIDVNLLLSTDGSTFHNAAGNYKWSTQHSNGTPTAAVIGSNSDTRIRLLPFNGTGTDEHYQSKVVINNAANTTRKKTADYTFSGLDSGGLMQRGIGAGILMANNNSIRGFRLDPASTATMSADRIRVRGRRLTPQVAGLQRDWELIEQKVVSGTTANVDFKDIPVLEFDELELVFKDVDCDTTANNIGMRMSNDNGATYDSGTNYHYAIHNRAAESTGYAQISSNTGTMMIMTANFGSTSVRLAHGRWYISGMAGGSRKNIFGQSSHINDAGNNRNQSGGGVWNGTGSDGVATAIRLLCDNGASFTAGTFTLRGRRKIA